MYKYELFDHCIASELYLDDLLRGSESSPVLTIRKFPLSEQIHNNDLIDIFPIAAEFFSKPLIIQKGVNFYRVNFRDLASFELYEKEILIFIHPGASENVVRLKLLSSVISLWLELKGHLVMHASAVLDKDNTVVMFIGHSGMGKTTLASSMVFYNGSSFFSDDLVPIHKKSPSIVALPGPPYMRLRDDQLSRYKLSQADSLNLPNKNKKVAINLDKSKFGSVCSHRAVVKRIYFINQINELSSSKTISFNSISHNDALLALIQCSFAAPVLGETGLQSNRIKQLAQIVETVSCKKVDLKGFTKDYEHISKMLHQDLEMI